MKESRRGRDLAVGLLVVACGACKATLEEQAREVAKNWSMVVRANQVIPVYPMTEDLQPGDVFLVDVPVPEQARVYKRAGFLPLDHHLARLPIAKGEFEAFYGDSYWAGDYGKELPHPRPRPSEPEAARPDPAAGEGNGDDEGDPAHRFASAPAPFAAFPTYSFSVEKGGGVDIGLPISGVPIALGLMNADKADVSVTISDALTYGMDTQRVWKRVRDWAEDPLVRARLAQLQQLHRPKQGAGPTLFLRVVNRVYLTGGVSITVARTSGGALSLSAGQERDVELVPLGDEAETQRGYEEHLDTLKTTLGDAVPGGSLKFGYATNSAVMMAETFERPLVIGYIGFDLPIYENGWLGPPVATKSVLLTGAAPPPSLADTTPDMRQYQLRSTELGVWAADPERQNFAAAVTVRAATLLKAEAFAAFVRAAPGTPAAEVVERFFRAADRYLAPSGEQGPRYKEVVFAIDAAIEQLEQDDE